MSMSTADKNKFARLQADIESYRQIQNDSNAEIYGLRNEAQQLGQMVDNQKFQIEQLEQQAQHWRMVAIHALSSSSNLESALSHTLEEMQMQNIKVTQKLPQKMWTIGTASGQSDKESELKVNRNASS